MSHHAGLLREAAEAIEAALHAAHVAMEAAGVSVEEALECGATEWESGQEVLVTVDGAERWALLLRRAAREIRKLRKSHGSP